MAMWHWECGGEWGRGLARWMARGFETTLLLWIECSPSSDIGRAGVLNMVGMRCLGNRDTLQGRFGFELELFEVWNYVGLWGVMMVVEYPGYPSAGPGYWGSCSSGRKTGDVLGSWLSSFDAEFFRGHCKCLFIWGIRHWDARGKPVRDRLLIPSGSRAFDAKSSSVLEWVLERNLRMMPRTKRLESLRWCY